MSRTRAGRKSWETRVNYNREAGNALEAIASADWKYDAETTKKMVIERTAKQTNKTEVITFSMAYGELSMWLDKVFVNISERGFSDMLAETFFQGAEVHTPKATYKMWVAPVKREESEPLMIALTDRRAEFIKALERAESSKLEVFANFERDSFTVVNSENSNEYEVRFLTRNGETFASCACADFVHRQRLCKHISEVIWFAFGGLIERVEEFSKPFVAVTFATNFKDGAKPVKKRSKTRSEAVASIARTAEIAGSCFQYGKVYDRSNTQVYALEVADFEEAFTYDFGYQY